MTREYMTLRDCLQGLKVFKPQLLDYPVDIFYVKDINGEAEEHLIWSGKLRDCDSYNPLFEKYKVLWHDALPFAHVIDICCEVAE